MNAKLSMVGLDSRRVAATTGFGTTKRLLAGVLRLSATEAGTRVAHAAQLAPRRAVSGEPLAPTLPNTAAALAAGEIGPAQVRVIVETMNAIPASVGPTQREAAEAELARHARSFDPTSLHKIGRHILAHLDPDGPKPHEEPEPAPAAGELRFQERRNGRLGLEGFLEPEHSAAFRSLIEQLAAPRYRGHLRPTHHPPAQRRRPAGGLRARPRRPRLPHHRRGTPTPHRHPQLGLIEPCADVVRRWATAPMSTRRDIARLLLTPQLIGELRITPSPTRGPRRVPAKEPIQWWRG
jgi:uncharacterized protein DUF222